jgi:beta-lactamase regulating signal transducer with metallopeptidase domain
MTPAAVPASASLIEQLLNPAARALVLAGAAGIGLVAFRLRSTSVRLFIWSTVLYGALAMPLLQQMLPPLPVPTPEFVQNVHFQFGAAQPVPEEAQVSWTLAVQARAAANEAVRARNEAVKVSSPADARERTASSSQIGRNSPPYAGTRLVAATPASSSLSEWSSIRQSSIPWTALAAAIYLTVTFILLVRFLVGLVFSSRLSRASQRIDEPRITLRLAARARAYRLPFVPRVAESEFISVPVTMGARRPTILLPSGWHEWDDAKLDAVVAHEVSHVARRDALTQRLSLLYRAIFWFSPLAWWLDRHLADLAEQASDEAALSCGADRKEYARTLLGFFEALQGAPGRVWWQGVSMAKAGQAEQRLERILAWKGSVAMHLKKSIAVAVVAFAVPVVYLAASVRPANFSAEPQHIHFAQDQTPRPAPRPAPEAQAQPDVTPEPAAPMSDATPPLEPTPQAEPAPAPAAIDGRITGTVRVRSSAMPAAAAVAAIAPRAVYVYPPPAVIAPVAPMQPPARWRGQSSRPGSSYSSSSYHYGYDDDQRFVIASGKTDSLTMSGSMDDAHHVEKLRKQIQGDFIWFERDGKSYVIRDQATIDRARQFWAPQEELGKKQEELGEQQEALGKQQEEIGKKMEQVQVKVPDMTAELDKLKAELKQLTSGATMEQVGRLQSEIGELQSKIGEVQSQAGEQQSKIGEQMGELGEKQGKLGEKQGELGRQQGELARQASRQMKQLLDEALKNGTAKPEQN